MRKLIVKKINNISFGLFNFKGRYFWRNIKDIPVFIKRIFFTLKYGYPPQAKWDTFDWFICVIKEILFNYRNNRVGTPMLDFNISIDENTVKYDQILDQMLEYLNQMEEDNPIYEGVNYPEQYAQMEQAKDKFFELFSKHFYNFWD